MEKDVPCKQYPKQNWSSCTKPRQICFRAKLMTRDKECYFLVINESIYQKDITILNIYVHNKRASRYMKQRLIELKREIDNAKNDKDVISHFQ